MSPVPTTIAPSARKGGPEGGGFGGGEGGDNAPDPRVRS